MKCDCSDKNCHGEQDCKNLAKTGSHKCDKCEERAAKLTLEVNGSERNPYQPR